MAKSLYVAGVLCILLVLGVLQVEAQFLPHLQPTGEGVSGVHRICDDCSDSVLLNMSFPFGNYCHTECRVSHC